jgi:hypothetical protein
MARATAPMQHQQGIHEHKDSVAMSDETKYEAD